MADAELNIDYFSLPDFGVVSAEGADAGKFLQGQLSNDVLKLTDGAAQLTALHTVQGRVQALLRLLRASETLYLALLPRDLVADVIGTLQKRVFRSRVRLSDASAHWQVRGASAPPPNRLHAPVDASGRCIVLAPATDPPEPAARTRDDWRARDIEAGVPQVYAATQGEFVAQMLNLDLLGGIAFDKGCYIGQEIVARAHYRGRVKRRLQRFQLPGDAAPDVAPGASLELPGGETLKVVDSLTQGTRIELLGVTTIGAHGALPMPYALPSD